MSKTIKIDDADVPAFNFDEAILFKSGKRTDEALSGYPGYAGKIVAGDLNIIVWVLIEYLCKLQDSRGCFLAHRAICHLK